MKILLISDIHANYPALEAIDNYFKTTTFDVVINCGDSVVYAPFPNETITWLINKKAISILGNTDKKVLKLLRGDTFKKPAKPEKRCMYTWTADTLTKKSVAYLRSLKNKSMFSPNNSPMTMGIYHGSPARNHEFLFTSTADEKFAELALLCEKDIILCGHSHDPFYKIIENKHFINPGSAGRMFDGNPDCSCAVIQLSDSGLKVQHYRITYDVSETIRAIHNASLPEIYCEMYRLGRKMN